MKAKRSHRVPLSDQAMAILRQVRYIPDPDADDDSIFQLLEVTEGRAFRMPTGKPLSENALLDRCEKDKIGATPHGFRTSPLGAGQRLNTAHGLRLSKWR